MTIEFEYHTKEAAIAAVTKSGRELEFCTSKLQNDEEVVMEAVKQDSLAFRYASKALKSNKHFIMKAIHEGVNPVFLIKFANVTIQSDIEIISLAIEKSEDGWEFRFAKGEAALNKDMAAKALVKWGNDNGIEDVHLLKELCPSIQECFPKDCWYEKAQSYLFQLEQDKQAELVTGGSKEEDGVVW